MGQLLSHATLTTSAPSHAPASRLGEEEAKAGEAQELPRASAGIFTASVAPLAAVRQGGQILQQGGGGTAARRSASRLSLSLSLLHCCAAASRNTTAAIDRGQEHCYPKAQSQSTLQIKHHGCPPLVIRATNRQFSLRRRPHRTFSGKDLLAAGLCVKIGKLAITSPPLPPLTPLHVPCPALCPK